MSAPDIANETLVTVEGVSVAVAGDKRTCFVGMVDRIGGGSSIVIIEGKALAPKGGLDRALWARRGLALASQTVGPGQGESRVWLALSSSRASDIGNSKAICCGSKRIVRKTDILAHFCAI